MQRSESERVALVILAELRAELHRDPTVAEVAHAAMRPGTGRAWGEGVLLAALGLNPDAPVRGGQQVCHCSDPDWCDRDGARFSSPRIARSWVVRE